ncbi:hypothetical protein E4H04_01080 [Candidatus Bathyarchaeota archaeon]|nr:MAG: hypothetical protein E4H04_01080 [Candidatus Bathyarchaeota archaeon]
MSEDYSVRWFNEGDVDAYIAGLNKALYDEYDEAIYDWKWRRNPNSVGFTSIAVVEHRIDGPVAFNSFLPMEIRRGAEVFKAVQGCDGFVDENHRRRGLFQKTLIFLGEEAPRINAEFLMGFNLVEAAGAARKAGSELAYDVNKCFLKPSENRRGIGQAVTLEPIKVDTLHELYMGWAQESRLFSLNRSMDYLRWKINEHPFKLVQPYGVYLGGTPIGYLVTDKVTEGEKTTLTINDYNPGLMNKHLGSIAEKLADLHDDITVIEMDTMQGGERQRTARRLGFEIVPWYQVIMKALHGTTQREGAVYRNGLKLSHIRNWHLAESDIY